MPKCSLFFFLSLWNKLKAPAVSKRPIHKGERVRLQAVKEWTSEKSLLTLSSLRSSISHYCPLIDFRSLIYGRKKMSQWNGLLIKLFNRFWAINPDLYIQVVSYFHILVSSIKGCQMRHLINNFTIFGALWGKSNIYISQNMKESLLFLITYKTNTDKMFVLFLSKIGIRATVV